MGDAVGPYSAVASAGSSGYIACKSQRFGFGGLSDFSPGDEYASLITHGSRALA